MISCRVVVIVSHRVSCRLVSGSPVAVELGSFGWIPCHSRCDSRVDSIGVVERSSRIEWLYGAFPGMEGVDSGDGCAASGPSGGEQLLGFFAYRLVEVYCGFRIVFRDWLRCMAGAEW